MFRSYAAAAIRNLLANPFNAGLMIAGLAIAFAAALLIAVFVRDEYSYDRWQPDHDRVYAVSQIMAPPGGGTLRIVDPTRSDLARLLPLDFPQIEAITRMVRAKPIVRRGEIEAIEPDFFWADPNLFDVLALHPVAGDLRAALQRPDGLVVTRSFARKYFGRDAPIGETLEVNPATGTRPGADPARTAPFNASHPMRVAAVVEDLPSNTHLQASAFGSGRAAFSELARIDAAPVAAFGQQAYTYLRLKRGASADAIRAGLPAFTARRIPTAPLAGTRLAFALTPIAGIHLSPPADLSLKPRGDKGADLAVATIGTLIVLVAAINFVILMTARASKRALEVGLRKACGAQRRDLVLQFLGETAVYVAVAMLVGLSLAEIALPGFNAFLQRRMSLDELAQPAVLAAVGGFCLTVAALAGLYPALVLSSFRPAATLAGNLRRSGSVALRQALVVGQFAILAVLTVTAVTIYGQTRFALDQGSQFRNDHVVWIDGACIPSFRERAMTLPGVLAVQCSSGGSLLWNDGAPTTARGRDGRIVPVQMGPVDFGFFGFYRIRPLAGRLLDAERGTDGRLMTDPGGPNPSVVLNRSAMHALGFVSPDAAVGRVVAWRRLLWRPGRRPPDLAPEMPSEIVGVVPNFSLASVREPIQPTLYYVDPALSGVASLKLDRERAPQTMRRLDALWRSLGHVRPLQIRFMVDVVRSRYADVVRQGEVVAVCAGLAIVIAGLGLLGLAAFATAQQTREIGVRKAMGAGRGDVLRLLLWGFLKPVLLANLIAAPLAWWLNQRWLHGFAAHITLGPAPFLAAALATVLIAAAVVFTHTLKAAKAAPVDALRCG